MNISFKNKFQFKFQKANIYYVLYVLVNFKYKILNKKIIQKHMMFQFTMKINKIKS